MSIRQLEQHLCNLKLYTKELAIQARKCAKEESKEKAKCKKAIQNNSMEKAQIFGENAIRQKNQSLNFQRLSARVDAIASKIQQAIATRKVTCSIGGVCKTMELAMKTLNLEMIAGCLDKFEGQLEDLDVQTAFTENAMSKSTTTSIPVAAVDNLLQSIADEAGLELKHDLPRSGTEAITEPTTSTAASAAAAAATEQEDELSARLARLRMK